MNSSGAKIAFVFYVLYFLISNPISVFAHTAGQPPFFKVNGTYADYYHVVASSTKEVPLPQDAAPGLYLSGSPISFVIDTQALGMPSEVVSKISFSWDFGDGHKGEGLQQTHTYDKIGSYILTIHASDGTIQEPQLFQSIMIHVVPDMEYKMPQAIPMVNGKIPADPLSDVVRLPFRSAVSFDGSHSTAGSAKIISYVWDLGDGKRGDGATLSHTYSSDLAIVFAFLRVTDENGFISDSYVEIDNTNDAADTKVSSSPGAGYIVGVVCAIVAGTVVLLIVYRRRRVKK